tara:strand:- start:5445 stop:5642 length:198 start_codon:yes stop_codon:yes gene_type:complete
MNKIQLILVIVIGLLVVLSGCSSSGYQSTGAASYQNNEKYVGGGCGVAQPAEGDLPTSGGLAPVL